MRAKGVLSTASQNQLYPHYLSKDDAQSLIYAFALSRLDCCNAVLSGCPKHLFVNLQKIQKNTASFFQFSYITSLQTLHWLPN